MTAGTGGRIGVTPEVLQSLSVAAATIVTPGNQNPAKNL